MRKRDHTLTGTWPLCVAEFGEFQLYCSFFKHGAPLASSSCFDGGCLIPATVYGYLVESAEATNDLSRLCESVLGVVIRSPLRWDHICSINGRVTTRETLVFRHVRCVQVSRIVLRIRADSV